MGYLWCKARDAAAVNYRLHDLRCFYASGLIAARYDVATIQRVAEGGRPDTQGCGCPACRCYIRHCGPTGDRQPEFDHVAVVGPNQLEGGVVS